jgi:hypothetical protein
MSQTQVEIQIQNQKVRPDSCGEMCSDVEFKIFSWGSCQRGYLEILYPKRVDLILVTRNRGDHVVNIPFAATIKYSNSDSSKNLHRTVEFIDISEPIVVMYHGAYSCSKSFKYVFAVEKSNGKLIFRNSIFKKN